ncbi:MAG: hypothetical protein DRO87_03195 [Candidatus Thorarchaeota archaeon]|nr:MAG: hypothetical protein DRP09_03645 [Candidatus Thorarchaeota archaeon]RLI59368.1 MAG: hypothetical protein DRO87_03195 [Candidatus Thorarchaeota archaeon]
MDTASEVALAVKRTPEESLATALSKLSDPIEFPTELEHVIVKPSIYNPRLVGNTSVSMTAAVVRMFQDVSPVLVVESDNPVRTADVAFKECGYDVLASERVSLLNLSSTPTKSMQMPGHHFRVHDFPEILQSRHFLVNVATLKPEPTTSIVGAGIKNLFGLLPEVDKSVYHADISSVLLDILERFPPDLTVIDLTSVVQGSREDGIDKHFGGVIVGRDPVAVDAFCAHLLGVDPLNVSYIKGAYEIGLGEALLDRIRIRGTRHQIELFSVHFQKGPIQKGFMNS